MINYWIIFNFNNYRNKSDAAPSTEVNSIQITVNNVTPTITVETVVNNNKPNMEGDDDENEDKNFKKPPVVVKRKNLKVNLQPGYSQMDWVRLSHSGKRSQSQ